MERVILWESLEQEGLWDSLLCLILLMFNTEAKTCLFSSLFILNRLNDPNCFFFSLFKITWICGKGWQSEGLTLNKFHCISSRFEKFRLTQKTTHVQYWVWDLKTKTKNTASQIYEQERDSGCVALSLPSLGILENSTES